ncbi:uncharacterized protein LOC123223590 isoform X2 [Mangifera indica]|uniref:uncharacterized protein LOC123223590 isoform X2 n=1 Tax=Mangifera indica TaxID=29780 RepID=UPI001CFC1A0F|nr:uncharacterized protein LOC123223590 isoform X2 [Mangifera indica]
MVTMDLKGIAWVGHVYQKFEAMCLEVEEVMYQDTIKYVENQAQTVGASVKKFYSDVVQDFLPPSSMDLVKGAATSNLPAEQYTDIGIYKRPKIIMKEEAMMVDHGQSNDSHATVDLDKDANDVPSFHGFDIEDTSFQPYSENTVKRTCSDSYSQQYGNRFCRKSGLGVKKISKEDNLSLRDMYGAVTHTEKDYHRPSIFSELSDKNKKALCNQRDVSPTPITVEVNACNCTEAISDKFENASKGTPGVVTDDQGCNEIEIAGAHSSCNDVSAEINDICKNDAVVSLAVSSMNRDVQPIEFPDEIILVCNPGLADDSTANTIESNIPLQQDLVIIQQVDNIQDEENCVLVNGDGLHFVPLKEHKHRPYKKKIQDAISSRMRSRRKQEYERLATLFQDNVTSNQQCAGSSMQTNLMGDMKRSPPHNPSESDWELL